MLSCPVQVLPPLEAAEISIAPDDVLLPAGNVSAIVEGLLVVQVAATSACCTHPNTLRDLSRRTVEVRGCQPSNPQILRLFYCCCKAPAVSVQ